MKKIMVLIPLFLSLSAIYSMEQEESGNRSLRAYAIPGMNGLGSDSRYVANLLGIPEENVIDVGTPFTMPDFGQTRCMRYLGQKQLSNIGEDDKNPIIIHATSQGTATTLNRLADSPDTQNICMVILEAAMASGNNTICHTVKGPLMGYPEVVNLPLSYYWLPYLAKFQFLFYRPAGKQAIKSINTIPINIPIVIIHSKGDLQISYDDACALYYGLRVQGNRHVYLISKEGDTHLQIMNTINDKNIIQAILKKHKLIEYTETQENLDVRIYQPDHMQFKKIYDELIGKEHNHEKLEYTLGIGTLCAVLYTLMSYN